jgi:hypothetical protein
MDSPKHTKLNRTVIDTIAVDCSNGWWTGLVRDRIETTGEIRLRLERYSPDRPNRPVTTWRVHPDYWKTEVEAVSNFEQLGQNASTKALPIDDFYTVKKYLLIRDELNRRVSVVRVEDEFNRTKKRLYHWNPHDESTKQKWTIGKNWNRLSRLATRKLNS